MRRLLLIIFLLAAHTAYSASFVIGFNGTVNITPTAYTGVGIGGGGRVGCAWKNMKVLLNTSVTSKSSYAEVQFTYKVSSVLYTGAAFGFTGIKTDYTADGRGYHAGLLLGLSTPVGKQSRFFFELCPRVCYVNVTTYRSSHGLSYRTDDGMRTHIAVPLNVGINFYLGGHKTVANTEKK